jgi:hypothetical protein
MDAPAQHAKIDKASAPDLFGTSLKPLEPAPFAVNYHYRCAALKCRGHDQKVLDWEAGQAGRQWLTSHGDTRALEMLLGNWRDTLLAPDRDVYFYVGNQNLHSRSFSVLGVWYPKTELALFYLHVYDGCVGPGFKEPARDEAAMALGVIVLEAEKSYSAVVE